MQTAIVPNPLALALAGEVYRAIGDSPGIIEVQRAFRIDPKNEVLIRPAMAFIPAGRFKPPAEDAGGPWDVTPMLVADVATAQLPATELVTRIDDYFKYGIKIVWILYPKSKLIYVYRSSTAVQILGELDEIDGGVTLPGFRLPLARLFADPRQRS